MVLGGSVRDLNTQISLIRLSRPTVHAADCHDRALVFGRSALARVSGESEVRQFMLMSSEDSCLHISCG